MNYNLTEVKAADDFVATGPQVRIVSEEREVNSLAFYVHQITSGDEGSSGGSSFTA